MFSAPPPAPPAVPAEVQALSSGISSYYVTQGNSIGTACGAYDEWPKLPTTMPTTTTELTGMNQKSFTGTIPTEFGTYTDMTAFNMYRNSLSGERGAGSGAS